MRIRENRLDEILKYWRAEPDQDVELLPTPHENAFLALDLKDARNQLKIAKAALQDIAEETGNHIARATLEQLK